jgi:hypothetical protein
MTAPDAEVAAVSRRPISSASLFFTETGESGDCLVTAGPARGEGSRQIPGVSCRPGTSLLP